MYKIFKLNLFITIALLMSGCGESNDTNSSDTESINERTLKVIAQIKKTSQIQSYYENGDVVFDSSVKDDGYYQTGNEKAYTRASEIVRDDLSALMWQDDIEVATILKSNLSDANFALCDANKSSISCTDTSGDTATTYCSTLALGGYTDWRLPSVYELSTIVNITKSPSIDEIFFNSTTDQYTSNNFYISEINHNLVWGVNFYNGTTSDYANNHKIRVRCVRDDNIQAVDINDTELEWQDNEISPTLKWTEAISYCEELNLNGMGWRLPNINELKSIVDYSKNNPAIKDSFLNTTPLYYWSSSSHHITKSSAWSVSFRSGLTSTPSKQNQLYVRCVR